MRDAEQGRHSRMGQLQGDFSGGRESVPDLDKSAAY